MPTTYSTATTTSTVSNAVVTVYDKLFRFKLRSQPLFRQWVDTRPVNVTNPGESVVFNLWQDFAQATSALTENVAPDPVAWSNTTQVTVTLAEYGNLALKTRRVSVDSLSDIDTSLANSMAYNAADSIDQLVQNKLASAGLQVAVRAAAARTYNDPTGTGNAANVNTVTTGDQITSSDVRFIISTLRSNKVQPRVDSGVGLYVGCIHPYVSADLRAETGAAAWRDPHVYNDGGVGNIWAGVVGEYEGCLFMESPRLTNTQAGAGTGATQYRVFDSYFLGAEAIAEAVNVEPEIRVGLVTDPLQRFAPIGWYGFLGWNVFRQESLVRYRCGSAVRPQA